MEALLRSILAQDPPEVGHRPHFFDPRSEQDVAALEALLRNTVGIRVHDRIVEQLEDLVRCENPAIKFAKNDLREAALARLKDTPAHRYGMWVYYPWNRTVVHLLAEAEFTVVRTDRNRNKITTEEQARLATKKVGVIGLSVGQSVALAMTLERGFGEIRLADFDLLELTNLNRIRSGVHEVGTLKVVNTAREIAEIDPYLKVTIFPEGITADNLDRFFSEGGDLDLLVEECDSVDIKIIARQKAQQLGVPVVMDMSDRGCLDIERYDLEPGRPLMHGWIDHLDLDAASKLVTSEDKIPFMLPIVGTKTLSPRMKASMIELGQTIGTWPQLATAVVLGGALAGDSARRILLGSSKGSGRWFVDLEQLVDPPAPQVDMAESPSTLPAMDAVVERVLHALQDDGGYQPLTDELLSDLAAAGAQAPSAGNDQPWHFVFHGGRLLVLHDRQRSRSHWDPDHLIAHLALGACVENIMLRADKHGVRLRCRSFPTPDHPELVAILEASDASSEGGVRDWGHLEKRILTRCTNRRVVARSPLPDPARELLIAATASIPGSQAHIFEDQDQLNELANICSGSEKVRILDPKGHADFFLQEVRWTPDEALRTGDGLDLATMEMSAADQAALQVAADPKAMDLVRAWGGGKALERFSRKGITQASAVLLVSAPGAGVVDRLNAGRALERAWLAADSAGLGVHPISAPIFLFHARGMLSGLDERLSAQLAELEGRFARLVPAGRVPLFMMRLSTVPPPSARSVRLPLTKAITRSGAAHGN